MACRAVLGVVCRVLCGKDAKVWVDGDRELPAAAARLSSDPAGAEAQVAAREHILNHAEHRVRRQVGLVEQQPQTVLDGFSERT